MIVHNKLLKADGVTPLVGVDITIYLSVKAAQDEAFNPLNKSSERLYAKLVTDDNGEWSVELLPNSTFLPASSNYKVMEGSFNVWRFIVPDTGISDWLYNLLIS